MALSVGCSVVLSVAILKFEVSLCISVIVLFMLLSALFLAWLITPSTRKMLDGHRWLP